MSFPSMAQSAGRFPGCELSVISEGSQSYLTSVEGDGDSTGRNHSFADSESHSSSTLQSGSHSNGRTTPFSQQESSLLGVCTQLDQENDDIDEMIIDVDSGTVVDQGGEIGVFRDDGAHHQPFSTLHQNYLQSSSSSSQSARQHHSNNNNNSSNNNNNNSKKKRLRHNNNNNSQRRRPMEAPSQDEPYHHHHRSDPTLLLHPDLEHATTTVSQHLESTAHPPEFSADEYSLTPSTDKQGGWSVCGCCCHCLPTWMQRSPVWFQVSILAGFFLLVACTTIGLVAARLQQQQQQREESSDSLASEQLISDLPAAPTAAPSSVYY